MYSITHTVISGNIPLFRNSLEQALNVLNHKIFQY